MREARTLERFKIERWRAAQRKEREFWSRTDYDRQLQRVRDRYAPLLVDLGVALPPGAAVIDVGSGPTCAGRFLEAEHRVFLDPLMDSYRRRFGAELPDGDLVGGRAEEIPAHDDSFDAAVCVNALDHMIDPGIVLAEIHRVLRPGGLLFLGLFVHPALLAVLRRAIDEWIPWLREDAHPFHFSRRSARDLVAQRFELENEVCVHERSDAWLLAIHREDRIFMARKAGVHALVTSIPSQPLRAVRARAVDGVSRVPPQPARGARRPKEVVGGSVGKG